MKTHRDDDHAVLWDDSVREVVEGGVWVVIERFQFLDEVVQLDERSEGLALVRSVHGRREELQHGAVLTVGLLTNLNGQKKSRHGAIHSDVFPHTNTHAVERKREDRSLERPSVLIKPNSRARC